MIEIIIAVVVSALLTFLITRNKYEKKLKERAAKQDNAVDQLLEITSFRNCLKEIINEAKTFDGLETVDQQQLRAADELYLMFHSRFEEDEMHNVDKDTLMKESRAIVIRYWDYKF